MKRILYDMGLLALVRWLLQSAFKFEPPFGQGSELKRVPPTQKLKKNKCILTLSGPTFQRAWFGRGGGAQRHPLENP